MQVFKRKFRPNQHHFRALAERCRSQAELINAQRDHIKTLKGFLGFQEFEHDEKPQ